MLLFNICTFPVVAHIHRSHHGLSLKALTLLIPPFILFLEEQDKRDKKRKEKWCDLTSTFFVPFSGIQCQVHRREDFFMGNRSPSLYPFFRGPRVLGDTLSRALSLSTEKEEERLESQINDLVRLFREVGDTSFSELVPCTV